MIYDLKYIKIRTKVQYVKSLDYQHLWHMGGLGP